jgi:arginine N-succinyltransferase
MLPRHPIYATLLPAAAQAAIGQAAPALAGRVAALVGEGFAEGQTVRVTDGGPVFEAPMQASATARAGASGWAAGADADELRRVPIRR